MWLLLGFFFHFSWQQWIIILYSDKKSESSYLVRISSCRLVQWILPRGQTATFSGCQPSSPPPPPPSPIARLQLILCWNSQAPTLPELTDIFPPYLTTNAGLGGSVGMAVWLETKRSWVQPPLRSATFFRGDWSGNIFYGHSLPSSDSRRVVFSFWQKNVHNTGKLLRGLSKRVVR